MAPDYKPYQEYEPAPSDAAHARARGVEVFTEDFSHLEPDDSTKVAARAATPGAEPDEDSLEDQNDEEPEEDEDDEDE